MCSLLQGASVSFWIPRDAGRVTRPISVCYSTILNVYLRIASGKPSGIENVHGIAVGSAFTLGGKELEVDCPVSKAEFTSGKYFEGNADIPSPQPSVRSSDSTLKPFKPLRPKTLNSPTVSTPAVKKSFSPTGSNALRGADALPERRVMKNEDTFWTANW